MTSIVPTRADTAAAAKATPVGELSPQAQQMIAERKQHSALIAQLKGATWAKEIDENTIRAIAVWAKLHDVDAATEIDVLGGNIYVNAKEAYRRLGELTTAGEITKHGPIDWIHYEERLDKLAAAGDEWATEEATRRLRLRIEHNVPEEATAAGIYRIWHRALSEPVVGCKWNQKGRKITINKKDGGTWEKQADPVGDLFPMEAVESRAIRRAMLKLRGAVDTLRARWTVQQEDGVALSEVVAAAKLREPQRVVPHALAAPGREYGDASEEVPAVRVPMLTAEDPYAGEPESEAA